MGANTIPAKFPDQIVCGSTWTGYELELNLDIFTEYLSPDDVAEINSAIKHFQGTGARVNCVVYFLNVHVLRAFELSPITFIVGVVSIVFKDLIHRPMTRRRE